MGTGMCHLEKLFRYILIWVQSLTVVADVLPVLVAGFMGLHDTEGDEIEHD